MFEPFETKYRRLGYDLIAGIDEVGRGALAGPLVAGAVILKPNTKLPGLDDSKRVTKSLRTTLAEIIIKSAVTYSYGVVEAGEIDKVGISKANKLAFDRAIKNLQTKPDFVLADYFKYELKVPTEGITKGDRRVRSIAAASIVAKVYRDNLMQNYHEQFKHYSFNTNVGYGTLKHRQAIAKHGLCKLHRKSFHLT